MTSDTRTEKSKRSRFFIRAAGLIIAGAGALVAYHAMNPDVFRRLVSLAGWNSRKIAGIQGVVIISVPLSVILAELIFVLRDAGFYRFMERVIEWALVRAFYIALAVLAVIVIVLACGAVGTLL